MAQPDFFEHLKYKVDNAVVDPTESLYDQWHTRADVVDSELEYEGINNPQLAEQVKRKILGEKPPNPSLWAQATEHFIPTLVSGLGNEVVGLGASLAAPDQSAYQLISERHSDKSEEEKIALAQELSVERAYNGLNKGFDNQTKEFIPFGIHERPEAGWFGRTVGKAIYEGGQEIKEFGKELDRSRGRPETKEEYLARQEKEARESPLTGWIDKLQAKAVSSGEFPVPGELFSQFGASVAPTLVGGAVGLTQAGVGALTKNRALIASAHGTFRGATLGATAFQVAGSMEDQLLSDDRFRNVILNKVLGEFPEHMQTTAKGRATIQRRVEKEMKAHAMDAVKRMVSDRLYSPASVMDFLSTSLAGKKLFRFGADIALEAGSEGMDEILSQTLLNTKLEELYRY